MGRSEDTGRRDQHRPHSPMSAATPATPRSPGRLLDGLSIRTRVLLLSALLLAGLIGSTLYLTSSLKSNLAQINRDAEMARRIDLIAGIRSSFGDYRHWVTDMAVSWLLSGFAVSRAIQSELEAKQTRTELDQKLTELAKSSPELANDIRVEVEKYATSARQAVAAYADDKRDAGNDLFAVSRMDGLAVDAHLNALTDQIAVEANLSRQAMVLTIENSTRNALIMMALTSLLGIIATWIVLRSILKPLDQVVTAINGITAGNLDTPIPPSGRDEIGAMAGTLQLFRQSIVDRERIAQISQNQQHMMTTAIETTSDGFAVFDREGRVIVCNTKFKELYPGIADLAESGVALTSIVSALVSRDLVDTGDLSGQAWVEKQVRSLPGSEGAFSCYRNPDTFIRISERATPDGGMVSVYTDVTELKRRQQELEAAMVEAEAANVAKSSFLANMSHELRTPLNAIIGYSEILQEMAQDDGLDEYSRDLVKIQSAGRHLLNLISDILDLSKIEAGKMDLYFEDVPIPELLDEISVIVKPLVKKNGNLLQIHCPPDIGTLHSDRTKLKQNLLNLLSNATKFTSSGTVTLTVDRDTSKPESPVTFKVQDTGIGMTPEQVAKLFSPFAQADASTTKRYGGTGLGLAITRHFCEILGGSIRVDSKAGVGSTFTMVLPSRLPSVAGSTGQSIPATESVGDVNAPLVMVVDDDSASRDLMAIVLRKEGWRVVEAGSGEVALEMARRLKPSAITLDIMMPRMDGWSVLTALKADPELAAIPVVVVTVAADRGFAFSLGANDFMTKPIDRMQLGSLMHHLLDEAATILMVDDDPQSRELVRHQLKLANISFIEAGSGKEAVQWLSMNELPSLILLDLMMPDMDGFMFLQEIARHPEWQSIPVVVLSAKELTAQEREWLSEHARAVIAKSAGSSRDLSTEVRLALRAPRGSGHSA